MMLGDLAEATSMRLRSLGEHHTVRLAADAFADSRLGLLIVSGTDDQVKGVVSKSDLVRHLAVAGSVDSPVTDIMTRTIISAAPGDDLRATWQLMINRRLQNLPLIDADRRAVGTLDIRDALQAILKLEEAQEGQLINYIAGVGYR